MSCASKSDKNWIDLVMEYVGRLYLVLFPWILHFRYKNFPSINRGTSPFSSLFLGIKSQNPVKFMTHSNDNKYQLHAIKLLFIKINMLSCSNGNGDKWTACVFNYFTFQYESRIHEGNNKMCGHGISKVNYRTLQGWLIKRRTLWIMSYEGFCKSLEILVYLSIRSRIVTINTCLGF